MKNTSKRIALLLALMMLLGTLLASCGEDELTANQKGNVHDPALKGYWIAEKTETVEESKTSTEDVAGEFGMEFYENGMVRMMVREAEEDENYYYYNCDTNYSDYTVIGKGKLALLNADNKIMLIVEYKVSDNKLTLLRYTGNEEYVLITYTRSDVPFYKNFPEKKK